LLKLPPTTEGFNENVAHAHLQVAIWKSVLDQSPPDLDPTVYGWTKDSDAETLSPITVPKGIPLAPVELLKLIICTCHSELPCSTKRCGCLTIGIACTVFCGCLGDGQCWNNASSDDEDEEETD